MPELNPLDACAQVPAKDWRGGQAEPGYQSARGQGSGGTKNLSQGGGEVAGDRTAPESKLQTCSTASDFTKHELNDKVMSNFKHGLI